VSITNSSPTQQATVNRHRREANSSNGVFDYRFVDCGFQGGDEAHEEPSGRDSFREGLGNMVLVFLFHESFLTFQIGRQGYTQGHLNRAVFFFQSILGKWGQKKPYNGT
jgi:hypothetical protein